METKIFSETLECLQITLMEVEEQYYKCPDFTEPTVDEAVVAQLVEMGFQANASRRAVITTGNMGSEAAMEWIMQHLDDPTLNDPLESSGVPRAAFIADSDALAQVMSMGFTKNQATKALQNTDNNVERAIDWIFSHPDDINEPLTPGNGNEGPSQPPSALPPGVTDGPSSK